MLCSKNLTLWPWISIGFQILLREYDTVARADNYFAEYCMLLLRRHSNEHDIFRGSCIDVIKSWLRKNLKAPTSSRIMSFLKEGEIRRRKKCSEHLKELDRNVGETEIDQTDANPGTDYKDICWQDGRRIVELKTLAEQLNVCDGCDTPLNLMNIEQERLHGFGSYLSIRCTTIAVLFHLFHSPVALPFHPIQGKRRERLHDVLPIKIHCRVIWCRNWRCLGLSWKMHCFCSVAKKQAHVPHYFLLKFYIKSLREYHDKILRKYQLSFFFLHANLVMKKPLNNPYSTNK